MISETRLVPFSLLDELFFHIDQPETPFGLHMHLRFDRPLDAARLADAVCRAAARHPLMRASLAPYSAHDRQYHWRIALELSEAPLAVVDASDEEQFATLRDHFYSQSVALDQQPPFRLLLVKHADHDSLLLNLHHAAADATGAYRLISAVLRAYLRCPDSEADVVFRDARDLIGQLGARNVVERLNRVRRLLEILGKSVMPPTRIAGEGGQAGDGVGLVPIRFSVADTRRLQSLRQDGATVNDVLLALLHLATARWNQEHGQRAGRITVMMPMNTRPPERRFEVISNLSLWVNVASRADQRVNWQRLLASVHRQTNTLKERGTAGLLIDLLHNIRHLPLWARQALPRLLPITGNRIVDSTVLNNIGRLPDPLPEGAELHIREWWFSTPCRLPMGMSVGSATFADQLHLTLRYSRQQFDEHGAWAFAELLLDTLEQVYSSETADLSG